MKVVLTGAGGQLGREIIRTAPADVKLVSCDRQLLDITNDYAVNDLIRSEKPDWLINAAAYTNVDRAESDMAAAFRVNRDAVAGLAKAMRSVQGKMLHVSTDYIFDGAKGGLYSVDDQPRPLSVYGESKLEGENEVLSVLGDNAVVLRSAWVYSAHGRNFVKTMLRLMSERDDLGVVCDQIGSPTWAHNLASAAWLLIQRDAEGVHHWTDGGVASWYDFAVAIRDEALRIGLLKTSVDVNPILSDEYPLPAKRPGCCVLDKTKTEQVIGACPGHWTGALRGMMGELRTS